MNKFSYLFYRPTARDLIRRDQEGLNISMFKYINKMSEDLKHEMNVNLYDKLRRVRDHHERINRMVNFDFNLMNINYHYHLY